MQRLRVPIKMSAESRRSAATSSPVLWPATRKSNRCDAIRLKIDTVYGRKKYSERLKILEPVFGDIRAQKRMDQFTLRGRTKVNIQWRLYCLVHNIEKILHYGYSFG